jgi:DnaA family protein
LLFRQLALDVRLADTHRFESFVGARWGLLKALLQKVADSDPDAEDQVFLHGPMGCGKTHLLQAVCQRADPEAGACGYLPLRRFIANDPAQIVDGLEQLRLLCIDDLDCLAESQPWQQALFALINTMRERGHQLVLAARRPPEGLGVELPDLVSRLVWGPVFRLEAPDDVALMAILVQRASARGLHLEERVCSYLLSHEVRDPQILLDLLDDLDLATLESRRRLTIPFVREQLRLRVASRVEGSGGA